MNVNGQETDDVFTCGIAGGDTEETEQCSEDSRIIIMGSETKCGIRIQTSVPDDTGKWTVTVGRILGGTMEDANKYVEIYTFNASIPMILDRTGGQELTSIEAYQNERVELRCNGQFGRPVPQIIWQINRNDRDELHSGSIFKIIEFNGNTYDLRQGKAL